jgi:hypothetical protein
MRREVEMSMYRVGVGVGDDEQSGENEISGDIGVSC